METLSRTKLLGGYFPCFLIRHYFVFLFSIFLLDSAAVQAQPEIQDMGFEEHVLDGTYQELAEDFGGWRVVEGSVAMHSASDQMALDGQFIDLSGANERGVIETTITGLVPGKQYVLGFFYASNLGAHRDDAVATLSIANEELTWLATNIAHEDGWQSQHIVFTAWSSEETLQLHSKATANACCGVLVDNFFISEAGNYVKDGGFETERLIPGKYKEFSGGSSVGPWQVSNGGVSLTEKTESTTGGAAADGQFIDMAGISKDGELSQDIEGLVPGTRYSLTFNYAKHSVTSQAHARVSIADLSETWQANNSGDLPWLSHNFVFRATDSTETLTFTSERATCCGMLIDNISITEYDLNTLRNDFEHASLRYGDTVRLFNSIHNYSIFNNNGFLQQYRNKPVHSGSSISDKRRSLFYIRRPLYKLAAEGCFSLESASLPNHYINHSGAPVKGEEIVARRLSVLPPSSYPNKMYDATYCLDGENIMTSGPTYKGHRIAVQGASRATSLMVPGYFDTIVMKEVKRWQDSYTISHIYDEGNFGFKKKSLCVEESSLKFCYYDVNENGNTVDENTWLVDYQHDASEYFTLQNTQSLEYMIDGGTGEVTLSLDSTGDLGLWKVEAIREDDFLLINKFSRRKLEVVNHRELTLTGSDEAANISTGNLFDFNLTHIPLRIFPEDFSHNNDKLYLSNNLRIRNLLFPTLIEGVEQSVKRYKVSINPGEPIEGWDYEFIDRPGFNIHHLGEEHQDYRYLENKIKAIARDKDFDGEAALEFVFEQLENAQSRQGPYMTGILWLGPSSGTTDYETWKGNIKDLLSSDEVKVTLQNEGEILTLKSQLKSHLFQSSYFGFLMRKENASGEGGILIHDPSGTTVPELQK
ncbi:DUF642 domain-containing protein [Marinibactrum halimedae]|uniref:DUF642 domain-containing protein n=1 Tax=Marinibactrum halimedae TaxID=1444977 RepID=A0AA37T4P5_9GAMM|nr:DUF642 domain-containing protein [Marinibactrum halimedae]MCD9458188.1 DUF642 domain-containing protein [Marinibactrum halimedae]GLS25123.1 hypothetical protein GCM10007877_08370 [Marinibactrum halimedae]